MGDTLRGINSPPAEVQTQLCVSTRVTRRLPPLEQELPIFPEQLNSPSSFSAVCVARSLVFCIVFCTSLFVHLSFYLWSLCCMSVFNLRVLITPLVSPSYSYTIVVTKTQISNIKPPILLNTPRDTDFYKTITDVNHDLRFA